MFPETIINEGQGGWDRLHRENVRPWDLKSVTPALKAFCELVENASVFEEISAILVPGCVQVSRETGRKTQGFNCDYFIPMRSSMIAFIWQESSHIAKSQAWISVPQPSKIVKMPPLKPVHPLI